MEFFLKNVPIYIYIHEKTELSSFKTDAKADYSVFGWIIALTFDLQCKTEMYFLFCI